jgi:hypothetical protein
MPAEVGWSEAPPSWALPVTVPGELVLIRAERMLAYIGPVWAYPTGFGFSLSVSMHPSSDWRTGFGGRGARPNGPVTRLQVRFDGRIADPAALRSAEVAAGQPVLRDCGWRSTAQEGHPNPRYVGRWWVSPLPQAGPVEFTVFLEGATEVTGSAQMDAGQITRAASRSVTLWADPGMESR